MDLLKEPKEEPLFDNYNENFVEERDIKEEEKSDDEVDSHFAMSSFFSPARSEFPRVMATEPVDPVKEEEIGPETESEKECKKNRKIERIDRKQKVSSVEGETELRSNRRPSRRASKSVNYKEPLEDSEGDEAPPVKRSKTVPVKTLEKNGKKRTSSNKAFQSDYSMKVSRMAKLNGTELECPECEYQTRSVKGWRNHLRDIHSITVRQAGLALRCDCGVDCFSETHFLTCERANAVVIKVEDKKDSELVKRNDSKLKCPECEFRTRSVNAWVTHLSKIHSTTPTQAGLALRCDCGHEGPSHHHSRTCESNNTTVILMRDMKKKETPQCVLCEVNPKTTRGYIDHLTIHHKTTLKKKEIYLKCDCGYKVTTQLSVQNHKECDGRHFTLHKIVDVSSGMAQPQPSINEVLAENSRLRHQFERACREARLEQLRAEHAESQLEDKTRVKEDAQRAMEKEKMEELEKREKAHQIEMEKLREENDKLKVENDMLRKRQEKRDTTETTQTRLVSSIDPLDTSDPTIPVDLSDNFSTVATFTRPTQKVKKEEPIVPEEEDNQIAARDLMDEQLPLEDEAPNDDLNSGMNYADMDYSLNEFDATAQRTIAGDSDSIVADMDSLNDGTGIEDMMDGTSQFEAGENEFEPMETTLTPKICDLREPAVADMDNIGHMDGIDQSEFVRSEHEDSMADDQIEREEETEENTGNVKESSVEEEIELRNNGRPSRRVSKAAKYNDSLEDSDGDEAPSVKKSRPEEQKKGTKRKMSIASMNGPKVTTLNKTELECPECEYRTRSVSGWRRHLNVIHSTTPRQEGLALRCDCGIDCFSDTHFLTCERANATVIKIEDKKESELVKTNDSELKCPECEHRTRSVIAWVSHLSRMHSITPTQAGLALRCDCGHEGPSDRHSRRCDSTNTIIIRKKHETPQCILCEVHPTSICGYYKHLNRNHKTTLNERGIYLKCSCDYRMTSERSYWKFHSKQCDGSKFTLHKLNED